MTTTLTILGIDPGYRTGCKVAAIDRTGKYIQGNTIYPHPPQKRWDESKAILHEMIEKNQVDVIAIGNGTASRETEAFVRGLQLEGDPVVVMVNESGASIYSASALAREEFPDHDVTVRGSVSIGRRLMDPLAELVKIDPKSIGVGQYQHDVMQSLLERKLGEVVESCVNQVGVDVNTASPELLTRVAGLGPILGPLVVAGVAFPSLEDPFVLLGEAVARRGRSRDRHRHRNGEEGEDDGVPDRQVPDVVGEDLTEVVQAGPLDGAGDDVVVGEGQAERGHHG